MQKFILKYKKVLPDGKWYKLMRRQKTFKSLEEAHSFVRELAKYNYIDFVISEK